MKPPFSENLDPNAAPADFETLPELLARALTRAPDAWLAFSAQGERLLTRREAGARVAAVAGWLRDRGVRRGDRVAFCAKGAEGLVVAMASAHLGAVFVSLPPRSSAAQFRHFIADAGPAAIVSDASHAQLLNDAAGSTPFTTSDELASTSALSGPEAEPVNPDDIAALCYTSGSTGRPKGVMVSHRNFLSATRRVSDYLRNHAGDRVLGLLPLSAPWGVLQWTSMLRCGGAVVAAPPGFGSELARTVRGAGVTGIAALPPTWIQLVDWLEARGETLPELRYVSSSGGVLPARVLDAMPRVFPRAEIFLTYGLTEAFRTTLVSPEWFERKKGSLGRACRGVDIAVRREDGAAAAPGEHGELVHHGECVTHGYWRQPEATAAVFGIGSDGCREHRSGDIVAQDADGFYWFIGRRDGLIKCGGHRLSADEIENAVLATGLVRHAVAWGVPDPALGQVVALALEPFEPAGQEALERSLRGVLPSYAQPRRIAWWTQPMPLTANGKIDRPAVITAEGLFGLKP